MSQVRYWMTSISKEHTMRGVNGSFIQVCHGKEAPLKRMHTGDYLVVYSSRETMEGDEKCQSFTAIGQVADDAVYAFRMTENFIPFRRNISFFNCIETPIAPLIPELDFITNKKSWGYPFRFGFFEITEKDFNLIVSKMRPDEVSR
ncbi:EVE domain-containing protein [Chitinophagaceae bacterium MMS25-I14]